MRIEQRAWVCCLCAGLPGFRWASYPGAKRALSPCLVHVRRNPMIFKLVLTSAISLDRKSTRLNSSHGYISYAVFCLKKNNIYLNLDVRNDSWLPLRAVVVLRAHALLHSKALAGSPD